MSQKTNRLAGEKSPYLLQHKTNPVEWYPWGSEAFEAARVQNKPIFLSIGYSTCYWCHVMEKDSFEIQEVADLLNRSFISIKVDREERPDIDQLYMDAVVGLTGHGGWPMSVFLTPERRPFFGGTFFPRAQFVEILGRIDELWRSDRERVAISAGEITQFLESNAKTESLGTFPPNAPAAALEYFIRVFDRKSGGFGGAPKFPQAPILSFLIRHAQRTEHEAARLMVEATLLAMMHGGIYDQLGGGFHRYATDANWKIPHFEKMLYDNALLAPIYTEAFLLTRKPFYLEVACETLDYMLRELTTGDGGFCSAQDAGDVGEEGDFYAWREGEIQGELDADEWKAFAAAFGDLTQPNFEGRKSVLTLIYGFPLEERNSTILKQTKAKLLTLRDARPRPALDTKVLTAWNSLAITALCKGYQASLQTQYLDASIRAAKHIENALLKNGKLLRRYRDGEAAIDGFLEDYAFFIQALLALYTTTGDVHWFTLARDLQKKQDELFWDDSACAYLFSQAGDEFLLTRKKELHDGALPAPNAVAAENLLRFYHSTGENAFREKAEKLFTAAAPLAETSPGAIAGLLDASSFLASETIELAVVAPKSGLKDALKGLWQLYLPHMVTIPGEHPVGKNYPEVLRDKKTGPDCATYYLCKNQSCESPTNNMNDLLARLQPKIRA